MTPTFFATAEAFRTWLAAHGDACPELIVGFHKVGSGQPSLTWPESVDEALCFGWIDGVRKGIDEDSYQIRFTPRRAGSLWSTVNIARAEQLTAEGRMEAAGLEAFGRRIERKTSVYSYEQAGTLVLAPDELKLFKKNKAAWAAYEKLPPGYRRTMTHWIVSAKKAEARARRLERFIQSCAEGVRLLP